MEMHKALNLFAVALAPRVREAVGLYVGRAREIAISSKDDQQAGEELAMITAPLLDYFRGGPVLRGVGHELV
jgi:hypothetical protein